MKIFSQRLAGVFFIFAINASATTHYVDLNSANATLPFTNWITAATNIQDAIDVAVAGDSIVVSNGVYRGGIVATNAIRLQSVNGAGVTWIDGSHAKGCANLADGAALTSFTLTNGYAFNGGGVYCASANTFVSSCLIVSNTAWGHYAGGVFGGTVSNCTVNYNLTPSGNGLDGGGAAFSVLFNCTIAGNYADSGGGVAYGTLNSCILRDNHAVWGGGAIACTLNNCLVSNNAASITPQSVGGSEALGGGLWAGTANNCMITGNRVSNPYGDTRVSEGGGAYASVLNNCVVFKNTANQYFGGGGGAYGGTLNNCTVVGNSTYATGGGTWNSTVNNSIIRFNGANYSGGTFNYCCTIPLPTGTGNITNDPAFVNQLAGDLHLQSNSPCINSGNDGYTTVASDLDGHPRIVGGTVDIGAYEFQSPSSVLSYAWAQQYGLLTDGSADFTDPDGDGLNNWQEWIAGTVPTNSLSVLAMLAPSNNVTGLQVSWQSVSGRNYFLQRATDLTAQPAFSAIQSNITGQADMTIYTDTTATNGGPYFYRVGVQ